MDYATTDLVLAILHHLLVFTLAGILAFEVHAKIACERSRCSPPVTWNLHCRNSPCRR
jgi:hypothetical protein